MVEECRGFRAIMDHKEGEEGLLFGRAWERRVREREGVEGVKMRVRVCLGPFIV